MVRWWCGPNGPLMWVWLIKMRNCTMARYAVNKARMVGIAEYSRDCYAHCARTSAFTMRGARERCNYFASNRHRWHCTRYRILRHHNIPFEFWTATAASRAEPALATVSTALLVACVSQMTRPATVECLRSILKGSGRSRSSFCLRYPIDRSMRLWACRPSDDGQRRIFSR